MPEGRPRAARRVGSYHTVDAKYCQNFGLGVAAPRGMSTEHVRPDAAKLFDIFILRKILLQQNVLATQAALSRQPRRLAAAYQADVKDVRARFIQSFPIVYA